MMCATWLTHLESRWQSLAWQPWLEAFSTDYALLSYDSHGCGLSDRDPADLSFEAWIRDFESVIDAAEFQQFSILAACQHGAVAIIDLLAREVDVMHRRGDPKIDAGMRFDKVTQPMYEPLGDENPATC